jgi:hypothetical protein
MKKAPRPEALSILGRTFKVSYENNLDSLGLCECEGKSAIAIREGQAPIEEADTIVHEMLHAIWYVMDIGLHKSEEHVVRKLATGLTLALKNNPQLLAYLSNPEVCALLKPPRR